MSSAAVAFTDRPRAPHLGRGVVDASLSNNRLARFGIEGADPLGPVSLSEAQRRSYLELPAQPFRQQFIQMVQAHPISVVVGPTGSGKTTVLSNALLDTEMEIHWALPRVVACWNAARYVAAQRDEPVGGRVGFETRPIRSFSGDTQLFFITQGLEVVRHFSRHAQKDHVLVIDEVHERSLDIDLLMGWALQEIRRGAPLRLVIASATLNLHKFQKYLGILIPKNPHAISPILSIPGRQYPLTTLPSVGTLADDVDHLFAMTEGQSGLVFLPGKREIEELSDELKGYGLRAEILPLHSEQSPKEQARCFARSSKPKIILATNVAESSLTVPGVRWVVDSGLVRRARVRGGIDCLVTESCSEFERQQRAGRAGREAPGYVILRNAFPGDERRIELDPEIHRTCLMSAALKVASAGYNLRDLNLIDAPDSGDVTHAHHQLRALQLMRGGDVTPAGYTIATALPVGAQIGAFLLHASRRECLSEAIVLAALLESGPVFLGHPVVGNRLQWKHDAVACGGRQSDLVGQIGAFQALKARYAETDRADLPALMDWYGARLKTFEHALDIETDLRRRFTEENIRQGFGEPVLNEIDLSRNRGSLTMAFLDTFPEWVFFKRPGNRLFFSRATGGLGDFALGEESVLNPAKITVVVANPFITGRANDGEGEFVPGRRILTMAAPLTMKQVPVDLRKWLWSLNAHEKSERRGRTHIAPRRGQHHRRW